ncbi:MAG: SPFH domain-containing protein [Chitinivibrionales bacterium]|nr:SPFH domain-containing protein [Chitinivibrionales bacterium]
MGSNNIIFLEVLEWFDSTGEQMVHRLPQEGSGEIKYGAQLIVRESQTGVFFYNGKAVHVFGPGRHTLKTANIPILTKIASLPWGMTSPLRAEVYFLNMKIFTNQKWGTKEPVAFKDEQLGLIRLRSHGMFNFRIIQPLLFINSLVGTLGSFSTEQVSVFLCDVIVSRLNDHLGENLKTLTELAGQYDEIALSLSQRLGEDFSHFGLQLQQLYINSITPPAEVQKAIDDRSKLGIFTQLDDLLKMKTALAIEKAAENQSMAGAASGMGVGMMMPMMLSSMLNPNPKQVASQQQQCPDCKQNIAADSQFCSFCGHQLVVFNQCAVCGKNLPAYANYCLKCGSAVNQKPHQKPCRQCGYGNLFNATFCNQCGERL